MPIPKTAFESQGTLQSKAEKRIKEVLLEQEITKISILLSTQRKLGRGPSLIVLTDKLGEGVNEVELVSVEKEVRTGWSQWLGVSCSLTPLGVSHN